MIKYTISRISDKLINNTLSCLMFIEVDTDEIKSTSFTIDFTMPHREPSKEFIEDLIRKKIEYIREVERVKRIGKETLIKIKDRFLYEEGIL